MINPKEEANKTKERFAAHDNSMLQAKFHKDAGLQNCNSLLQLRKFKSKYQHYSSNSKTRFEF